MSQDELEEKLAERMKEHIDSADCCELVILGKQFIKGCDCLSCGVILNYCNQLEKFIQSDAQP